MDLWPGIQPGALAAATGTAAGSIMDAETAYTHSFLNILLFILKTSFSPKWKRIWKNKNYIFSAPEWLAIYFKFSRFCCAWQVFRHFFFVPENTNLKATYTYIMNSKDSCSYHSFFVFRFWASAGFGINRGCLFFCAYNFVFLSYQLNWLS